MEGLRKLGEPEDARFRLHNVARLGLGGVALAPRGCKCTATAQDSIDHRSGMQAGFARGSSFLEIGEWNMCLGRFADKHHTSISPGGAA